MIALVLAGCSGGQPAAQAPADTAAAAIPELASFSPADLKQGKKLFAANCGRCHVGGQTYGTYGSTDVNLSFARLSESTPPRNTVDALIDYMKKPTSFDGKTDLIKTGEHASYEGLGDDKLRLIAAHIIKEGKSNPGWGKGKNIR
ncbi:c-type cytochrome [Gloeobacter kilaueensis]|uniref:c-type cytochrome n=1 Tax=Gloeobacter kilaueensis TaxID=1416614 RepID=UPI0016517572|nr:c-type cytochrome [Gloeobacter kilaueensis]